MRISLQIPYFKYGDTPNDIRPKLKAMAQTAEAAGFYSIWVMDHFFQLGGWLGPHEDPMLEGYSTLTYLAGLTEKVKLGTLVTGVIYRNPGFLAKAVTTLDVLSGGRAYFGVGAAWFERESKALGFPFPPVATRFEMLEEALQIARQMWSDNDGAYNGKHYQLAETINNPQPIQKPYPPIMIGGMGEKKTLRFVAQYADATNLFARMGVDVLKHKLDVLRQHCDDLGRDYDTIEKTTLSTVFGPDEPSTPADIIAFCRELAGIGIEHAIFNMPVAHDIKPLETIGKEVIPAVADL